jgi:hypothetical protein
MDENLNKRLKVAQTEVFILSLKKYISDYKKKNLKLNEAQKAINDFKKEWGTICDTDENAKNYGLALHIYIGATYLTTKNKISEINATSYSRKFNKIRELAEDFEKKFKNQEDLIQAIFYNLGKCFLNLGDAHHNKAILLFKKCLVYNYKKKDPSKNDKHYSTAYIFKKCSTSLYQSLINNELHISSPTTFNDPFDCPVLSYLNKKDEINSSIYKIYIDCLKIACFIRPNYNVEPDVPINDVKREVAEKEVLSNNLMWAHYAESHKGICIKYNLDKLSKQLIKTEEKIVSYLKSVEYSNEDIKLKLQKDPSYLVNTFFLKGKEWEYENELRFLYFDAEGQGEHAAIPIKNCIEAIYFGLRCSKKDKETIINIMKDYEVEKIDSNGKIVKETIKLYQMEIDETHFGQLKATPIEKI